MIVVKATVIDSTHLELSVPIDAPNGGTVLVSLAESGEQGDERLQWLAASAQSLQSAYADSEPDYESFMVREQNPEYTP